MKTLRFVRALGAVAIAATGVVAGGVQHSSGSAIASVAITSPADGASVNGDVNVSARAYGQDADPPQKIEFFVDQEKRPASTEDCIDGSITCYAGFTWHADVVGHHWLAARVFLVDGRSSTTSEKVHVVVAADVVLTVHHAKGVVAGHKMTVSGRVRSASKGHPGARNVPVTLELTPGYGAVRTFHVRTDRHGYYRKKVRAVANTSIFVETASTRMYLGTPSQTYTQAVHGDPHCSLARTHTRPKKFVAMRCDMKGFPGGSKFIGQIRLHGKWRRGGVFTSTHDNYTKIFVGRSKPGTVVVREIFPLNHNFVRTVGPVVRLHVS